MRITRLWLTDFRNYPAAELEPAPDGLTVVVGPNGEGKTNLLEAIGYLAQLSSFRGAPDEALVRDGAARAIVRAEAERDGRRLLLEAELNLSGRHRFLLNRQPLRRARDLLGAVRVSVFSPDDLALLKGGPSLRRQFLDDVLVALSPQRAALRADVDRILRQRGALLRQAGPRPGADVLSTLDVWDAKLTAAGEALAEARVEVVGLLGPEVSKAYASLSRSPAVVELAYVAPWRDHGGLAAALAGARNDDLRRAVSTVGPHRDDLAVSLAGLPARTHASQGEQRTLALALRLGAHSGVTEVTGSPPVLLLDDVFSELDPERSSALLAHLPPGQALLTTAGRVPDDAHPERVVHVRDGKLVA